MTEGERRPPQDFGEFRELLSGHFDSLSPHLQRIGEYALGAPNRFALQTVAEVAVETGVQPSTLIRFAKTFGFSGYSELRQLFRARMLVAEQSSNERFAAQKQRIGNADSGDPHGKLQAFADASMLAIEGLKAQIDAEAVAEAVRLLDGARTIHVIGRGRAWPVSLCLVGGLIEIERAASALNGLAGMIGEQARTMDADDVLIALGYGEESPELVDAIVGVRARQVPVIAITDSAVSAIGRNASVSVVVPEPDIRPFPPLAAHVVLAQSLVFALHGRGSSTEGS